MALFQKGHKLAKGGKRPGSGRPSKQQVKVKREAEEIARGILEKNLNTIFDSYLKLIKGRIVKHFDKVTGVLICEEEVIDSAAVRDAVKKVLPDRAPEDNQGNAAMPGYSLTIITK